MISRGIIKFYKTVRFARPGHWPRLTINHFVLRSSEEQYQRDHGVRLMMEAATAPTKPLELQIAITVDWEGEHLESGNLQSLRSLGELIPGPLVHFLNPGYFTRNDLGSASFIRERISSALTPGDELGLHLHAPRLLVRRAGVKLPQVPRFAFQTLCLEIFILSSC